MDGWSRQCQGRRPMKSSALHPPAAQGVDPATAGAAWATQAILQCFLMAPTAPTQMDCYAIPLRSIVMESITLARGRDARELGTGEHKLRTTAHLDTYIRIVPTRYHYLSCCRLPGAAMVQGRVPNSFGNVLPRCSKRLGNVFR